MRTLITFILMMSLLALTTLAQDQPGPAKAPVAGAQPALQRGPVLTGEDGKPIQGVRLASARVDAVVEGTIAQTTMTLTFANDLDRILGGELVFPLPEGATVTGYALDINGNMVDGVAVEKQRARIIYEQELHKRVDPGIVEHVAGNAFRTRLYPIQPSQNRKVRIEYVATIDPAAFDAGKPAFALPIGWKDVVDKVDVKIEVRNATAAPVLAGGAGDQSAMKAQKTDGGFVLAGTVPTSAIGDGLTIVLPPMPARGVSVEKREKMARTMDELDEQKARGEAKGFDQFEHFFLISDTPTAAEPQRPHLKNKRIGVVWDASLSRADVDHSRELKLLESALKQFGNPGLDVIVVRNETEVRPYFPASPESSAKAIEYIKGLTYDGATNLGGLILPKSVHDYPVQSNERQAPYDFFLLFTDGLGNLGAEMPKRVEAPVYAIADADRVNHTMLQPLCQQSGGAYFNLKRMTDDTVLAGIGTSPFSLVSVECAAQQIADVYPIPGTPVGGRFVASGRLLTPEAKVTLNYGYGKEITHRETFTIKADGASEGTLLPRFWAQQKVAALSLNPEKNADELAKVGKQFNLVTPNTSLLVLETVEQYVQYRVVPPKNRPEVYKEFLAKIEQNKAEETQTREQKIQQIAAMWNARVKWWETKFEYPKDLKVKAEVAQQGQGGGLFGSAPTTSPATAVPIGESVAAPVIARRSAYDPQESSRLGAAGERSPVSSPEPTPAPVPSPAPRQEQRQAMQNQTAAEDAGVQRAYISDLNAVDSTRLGQIRREGFFDWDERAGFKDSAPPSVSAPSIAIKAWDPNTPYLAAMKAVPGDKAYAVYLEQRKTFGRSPAFYLDCADYLVNNNQRALGVRVLTDIAEMQLEDARLLRVAAHRLMQIGERELAIDLFDKVLKLRPEEPQSYRDLALALSDRADAAIDGGNQQGTDRAISDYARALELLNKVVVGNWPRFQEIELPVLMEAHRIAARAQRFPGVHDFHNPLDSRLQKNLDLDVRVVMTWDADQTDIDLWVTEPSGEKCFYQHNRTTIGGLLSRDFTDGYGPEEYCLRQLMPGQYKIQANFYGSRQQELTGPATVQATVITDFGRPTEKRQALTLRLKDMKDVVDVGTVTLGARQSKAEAMPSGKVNR